MTEDEAETVAALAAQCAWGAGKNAYQRAVDSGLLYAEGYAPPARHHDLLGMVP